MFHMHLMMQNTRSMSKRNFPALLAEIRTLVETVPSLVALQESIVENIGRKLPGYDWVGFYMLDPEDHSSLVLGPFLGTPTPHVRISVNLGICGAAVVEGRTIIVDDVSRDPRYLSCSIHTKSEIVVPIRVRGRIFGEIDVDSHQLKAFGSADRAFLEECAELVGGYIEKRTSVESRSLPA